MGCIHKKALARRRGGRWRSVRRPTRRETSGRPPPRLTESSTPLPASDVAPINHAQQNLPVGQQDRRRVEVVIWNKIRGFLDWLRPDFVSSARERCATECVVSSNRQRLSKADGVIFHAKTHTPADFPRRKPPGSQYLLVSLEQEKYAPLLRQRNYLSRFDGIMTFNLNSTLPMITIHPHWDADHYFEAQMQPWKMKLDPASAFVSNCRNAGAQERLDFLTRLMDHYPVHSYGRCLNNKKEPALQKGQQRGDAKRRILASYKFYLAFENDVRSRDYVSEKVYDAILAGTLPVYRGTETVRKLLPAPDAIVNVADFDDDPVRLARHLQYLARNQSAYNSYFAWREKPRDEPAARASFQTILDMSAYKYTALCRICAYLDAKKLRQSAR